MIKQIGKTIGFTVGKAIPITVFNNGKDHDAFAQEIKKHVYRLEKNPNAIFRQYE
jgi:hypothetical protein